MRMRAAIAGAVLVGGAMALAGCGSDSSAEAPPPIVTAVSEATWTAGPWPFTVSEGVLRCRYSYQVTFTANEPGTYHIHAANNGADSVFVLTVSAAATPEPTAVPTPMPEPTSADSTPQ